MGKHKADTCDFMERYTTHCSECDDVLLEHHKRRCRICGDPMNFNKWKHRYKVERNERKKIEDRAQKAFAMIEAAEAESALIATGTVELIEENSRLISERDEWKSMATKAMAELMAIRNHIQFAQELEPGNEIQKTRKKTS